uniref:Uncharacterized protein n=1 Tax=Cannabis sativa TaxID=3483 RepID=A0A803Q6B3_CANSA
PKPLRSNWNSSSSPSSRTKLSPSPLGQTRTPSPSNRDPKPLKSGTLSPIITFFQSKNPATFTVREPSTPTLSSSSLPLSVFAH